MHLDKKGQANVAILSVTAIIGVIAIIIFAEIYATSNKAAISTSAQSILDLTDLILASILVIALLAGLAFAITRR